MGIFVRQRSYEMMPWSYEPAFWSYRNCILSLRLDVVCFQRVAGGPLEVGDGFVQLGAGAEFVAAGDREGRLTFEDSVYIGLAFV